MSKFFKIIMTEDEIARVNRLTHTPPVNFSIRDFCMHFDLIGDARLELFEKLSQDEDEKCSIVIDSFDSDGIYNPNKDDCDAVTVYMIQIEYFNPEDEFLLELSV